MAKGTVKKKSAGPACALCGKPVSAEYRPFCSRGCKDRDLLKWLGEGYRIEGPPAMVPGADDENEL